jgi:regulator of cell morphogenesis and NO signaling
MRDELMSHMRKEELVLFPYVEALAGSSRPFAPFGTVQNPIRMMNAEHEDVGDALRAMRALSNDYAVPADACGSFRALYDGLRALDEELKAHIHLENVVMFPRAIEAERTRS